MNEDEINVLDYQYELKFARYITVLFFERALPKQGFVERVLLKSG